MTELVEITITAPNQGWFTTFVRDILDEHLCASAHVDEIRSTYWWSNQVNYRSEYRAVIHTRLALVPHIIAATKRTHPYEVPCVVAKPITTGNPDYLDWIVRETRDP